MNTTTDLVIRPIHNLSVDNDYACASAFGMLNGHTYALESAMFADDKTLRAAVVEFLMNARSIDASLSKWHDERKAKFSYNSTSLTA